MAPKILKKKTKKPMNSNFIAVDPSITPEEAKRRSDEDSAAILADEMAGSPCPVGGKSADQQDNEAEWDAENHTRRYVKGDPEFECPGCIEGDPYHQDRCLVGKEKPPTPTPTRIDLTKEWCAEAAAREDGCEVGAGGEPTSVGFQCPDCNGEWIRRDAHLKQLRGMKRAVVEGLSDIAKHCSKCGNNRAGFSRLTEQVRSTIEYIDDKWVSPEAAEALKDQITVLTAERDDARKKSLLSLHEKVQLKENCEALQKQCVELQTDVLAYQHDAEVAEAERNELQVHCGALGRKLADAEACRDKWHTASDLNANSHGHSLFRESMLEKQLEGIQKELEDPPPTGNKRRPPIAFVDYDLAVAERDRLRKEVESLAYARPGLLTRTLIKVLERLS